MLNAPPAPTEQERKNLTSTMKDMLNSHAEGGDAGAPERGGAKRARRR